MANKYGIDVKKNSFIEIAKKLKAFSGKKYSAEVFNKLPYEKRKMYLRAAFGEIVNNSKNISCISKDHEDVHPSMGFDSESNRFHCFSCGATFDVFDIIGATYGLQRFSEQYAKAVGIFVEKGADLRCNCAKASYKAPTRMISKEQSKTYSNKFYYELFDGSECSKKVAEYLQKYRMLPLNNTRDIRAWEYSGKYYAVFICSDDSAVRRLCYDTTAPNGVNPFGCADYSQRYWNTKGEIGFFNKSALDSDDIVFVCEGAINAITIMSYTGHPAVATNSIVNFNKLTEYEGKKLILLSDNDYTGREKAKKFRGKFYVPDYLLGGDCLESGLSKANDVNSLLLTKIVDGKITLPPLTPDELCIELEKIYDDAKRYYGVSNKNTKINVNGEEMNAVEKVEVKDVDTQQLKENMQNSVSGTEADLASACTSDEVLQLFNGAQEAGAVPEQKLEPFSDKALEPIVAEKSEDCNECLAAIMSSQSATVTFEKFRNTFADKPQRFATGIDFLDELLHGGIYNGLSVICGAPNTGKTTLLVQAAVVMSSMGQPVVFISKDMRKEEIQLKAMAFASNYFDDTALSINRPEEMLCIGNDDAAAMASYEQAKNTYLTRCANFHIYEFENISDSKFIGSLEKNYNVEVTNDIQMIEILARAYSELYKKPPVIFVDSLHTIASSLGVAQKEAVDGVLSAIKSIHRKYGIPIVLVSNLSRAFYMDVDIRGNKESGNIEYDCSQVIGLQVNNSYINIDDFRKDDFRLIVLKNLKDRAGGYLEKNVIFDVRKGIFYADSELEATEVKEPSVKKQKPAQKPESNGKNAFDKMIKEIDG